MSRHGIALVLSAPSGAGKTTLTKRLLEEFPHFSFSISCTTRKAREGETDGVSYHFIDTDLFLKRRDEGYFAEWANVHGNYYGTPLEPLRNMLDQGHDVLFDIDVQGAKQLKQSLPQALLVFIAPPSMEELARRLRNRGTDSEATIETRLANAYQELAEAYWYDALIVNDDLSRAYGDLKAVYCAARLAPSRNRDFLTALCGQKVSLHG